MNDMFKQGQEFADCLYFCHRGAFKFIKYIIIALIISALVGLTARFVSASALTTSTVNNVYGNSSVVNELLSLVPEGDKYDYVVFRDGDYSYYLFYGHDFSIQNDILSAPNDTNYVHYYRLGSGVSYTYQYDFGVDSLSLYVNDVVTSNMDFELASSSWNFENYQNQVLAVICLLAFLPILVFVNALGVIKREFI